MTDKQIIKDDIDVSKCEYYKEYSAPNEDGDEYNDICECSITDSAFCFDECNSNCYYKQLKQAEQECEELKQTLAEIKPILEFYANSNMGEEQPDKTYHIMLNGSYIMVYDPKPARQALQKISEVENSRNKT